MDFESLKDENSLEKRLGLITDKRLQQVFHCTRQKRSMYYLTMRDGNENYYFPNRNRRLKMKENVSDYRIGAYVGNHLSSEIIRKKSLKKLPRPKSNRTRRRISLELEDMMNEVSDQNAKLPKIFQSVMGKDRQCFKRNEYKDTLNRNFRANMRISFLEERIQRREMQFLVETRKLHALKTKLMNLKGEFDKYVEIDHKSTMSIMDSAKDAVNVNKKKMDYLQTTLSELGTIKNDMNDLHEDYERVRSCEQFLKKISTDSHKKSVQWESFLSSTPAEVQDDKDFHFNNTDEFYRLFYEQEFTCYRLIEQVLELELLCENTREVSSRTEIVFNALMDHLENIRVNLEEGIKDEEKAYVDAKSYALELIEGPFYDVISGRESLLITCYLQELHQLCFVSSNYSLPPTEMFSALEQEYRALQFEEDSFPAIPYQETVMKHRLKKTKDLELSERMRKNLNEIDMKTKRVSKLLEPPKRTVTKKLKHRSELLEKPVEVPPSTPPISDREKLYLLLFTNRCDIESITRHNVNVDQTLIDKYFPK